MTYPAPKKRCTSNLILDAVEYPGALDVPVRSVRPRKPYCEVFPPRRSLRCIQDTSPWDHYFWIEEERSLNTTEVKNSIIRPHTPPKMKCSALPKLPCNM